MPFQSWIVCRSSIVDHGTARFDRDLSWEELQRLSDAGRAEQRWHPCIRLFIIAGGASALWAIIFAAIL